MSTENGWQRKKQEAIEEIELSNNNVMRMLKRKVKYNYLGILETYSIKKKKMKDKEKDLKRINIWKNKLDQKCDQR